jgi:hypothetical protein
MHIDTRQKKKVGYPLTHITAAQQQQHCDLLVYTPSPDFET